MRSQEGGSNDTAQAREPASLEVDIFFHTWKWGSAFFFSFFLFFFSKLWTTMWGGRGGAPKGARGRSTFGALWGGEAEATAPLP